MRFVPTRRPFQPGEIFWTRSGLPRVRGGATLLAGMMATVAATAFGQADDARFANWSKVESATEARAYKDAMRAGGGFDAASRTFLEDIALPQLALEANRATIERVRKRMREFLLSDIANDKTADEANRSVLTFMQALAGKDDAEPATRINAMLLIGELQGMDRKPWPPAGSVLAESVANAELPKAVRIAACVGLNRHVEAIKGVAEEQQRLAAVAVPAIRTVLQEGVTGDEGNADKKSAAAEVAVETDWMTSRCLSMLTMLGPLSPALAADVTRILEAPGRAINVRVRAAAALASSAGPDSKVDAAAAIKAIGEVAIAALERDVTAADKVALDRQFGGGTGGPLPGQPPGMMPPGMMPPGMMPPGMMQPSGFGPTGMPIEPGSPGQPGIEDLLPRESCRRAAWRLSVLADAILTDDSKRGLARLGGEASPADTELSQRLRRAAMELDAAPEMGTLRQALAALKPPPAKTDTDDEPPVEPAKKSTPAARVKG